MQNFPVIYELQVRQREGKPVRRKPFIEAPGMKTFAELCIGYQTIKPGDVFIPGKEYWDNQWGEDRKPIGYKEELEVTSVYNGRDGLPLSVGIRYLYGDDAFAFAFIRVRDDEIEDRGARIDSPLSRRGAAPSLMHVEQPTRVPARMESRLMQPEARPMRWIESSKLQSEPNALQLWGYGTVLLVLAWACAIVFWPVVLIGSLIGMVFGPANTLRFWGWMVAGALEVGLILGGIVFVVLYTIYEG